MHTPSAMGKPFEFEPRQLDAPIQTANRHIATPIPHPDDRGIVETLRRCEPMSMSGQPLVVWHRAAGVHVFDRHGNQWLDFSSGVLVTNAGHARPEAVAAIQEVAGRLHHSYCFPNQERAALVDYLLEHCAPAYLDKVFLLTTGSEAIECAIKVARARAHQISGPEKDIIVTFTGDFHGRTLGAQMAGGIPSLKDWIVNHDPCMVNAPIPDGFRGQDTTFAGFLEALASQGVDPKNIAGICLETYQGGTAILLPRDYMEQLRAFCDEHQALLIFDEVQAGFGRCGKMWGFEHYGVRGDLIVCGKGISSGLPLSAVIGHSDWMNLFPPGSMTSTHTGNPVCCAAALANVRYIVEHDLVGNAARLERVLQASMDRLAAAYPGKVGCARAVGLVGAVQMILDTTTLAPDHDTAFAIVKDAVEHGLMLFGPVGQGGGTVKLCPPLCITDEQLEEGLAVLEESFARVLG
ncbi:MAG TPA: aspartate aminotransferase family protein [Verrucomicrobiales bacterium]|nr:aspartate aminotransferase family protein [Verrucomicrobiales bacterium]